MKKSIIFIFPLFFIALFSNFTTSKTEVHQVLQIAFEVEGFQEFIQEKTANVPLIIATNQLIPADFELDYDNKNITVVENTQSLVGQTQQPVLELTDFELKKRKSTLKFQYGEYKILIKLKKGEGKWVSSYSYIRGNGYLNFTF